MPPKVMTRRNACTSLYSRGKQHAEQDAKVLVKEASKSIHKEIRAIKRTKKSAKIARVLHEFKDLQRFVDIRNCGKRTCISSVMDKNSIEKSDTDDIAEVFAGF